MKPHTHNPNNKCTKHLKQEQSMIRLAQELKALKKMRLAHPKNSAEITARIDQAETILNKYHQSQVLIFGAHYHDVPEVTKQKECLFPPLKGIKNG